MRAFAAFTKKEFIESLRTYRLAVLLAVFLLLGVMSPLVAKLLPEILKGAAVTGIAFELPEPAAINAWEQFFSNVGQMGMLALIITFCGITANELSRGTLINLLTKGMKRHTVIYAKFLTASVLWTAGYLLCLAVCYAYTEYYWPAGSLSEPFLAFASLWLFGELLIATLIFSGILFGSFYGSLLACFGVIITLSIMNVAPSVQKYNPIILAGGTVNLLSAQQEAADFIPAAIICAAAAVLLVAASVAAFNKKKL